MLAQIGAYISFLPLLLILVPLEAAALAPDHKAALLGEIASLGAVVAGGSNVLAGWVSDHTRSPWGRRRPWIVGGALATAFSYGLIVAARTPLALIGAILAFQLAFNFAFAPLLALIPDRVPDRQKGWVSALAGLGMPLGSFIGAFVVGVLVRDETQRFAALGAIVVAAIVPFAVLIRDPAPGPAVASARDRVAAGRIGRGSRPFKADFAYVWVGRCFVQMAFGLVQIYLLFYLQDSLAYGVVRPGRPETDMARLSVVFAIANVTSGLLAGRLSDHLGRRKPFVMGGALAMAAAAGGLAAARAWPQMAASYALLGCGAGCYFAVDLALVSQVLPSSRTVGRDLGLVNLSITIPQVAAPALASLLLTLPGANLRWVFAVAAALATLGAAMVTAIRQIR